MWTVFLTCVLHVVAKLGLDHPRDSKESLIAIAYAHLSVALALLSDVHEMKLGGETLKGHLRRS